MSSKHLMLFILILQVMLILLSGTIVVLALTGPTPSAAIDFLWGVVFGVNVVTIGKTYREYKKN